MVNIRKRKIHTKVRKLKSGKTVGGNPFTVGAAIATILAPLVEQGFLMQRLLVK